MTQKLERRFRPLGDSFFNLDSDEDYFKLITLASQIPPVVQPVRPGAGDGPEEQGGHSPPPGLYEVDLHEVTAGSESEVVAGGKIACSRWMRRWQGEVAQKRLAVAEDTDIITKKDHVPGVDSVFQEEAPGEGTEASGSESGEDSGEPGLEDEGGETECPVVHSSGRGAPKAGVSAEKGPVHTVMLQNLPPHVTQRSLAASLDELGFGGKYDFLYLPSSFQSGRCHDYAFINFPLPANARRLMQIWDRRRPFGKHEGTALHDVKVRPALIQGLEANVARWNSAKMRRVRNPELRPLFLAADAGKAPVQKTKRRGSNMKPLSPCAMGPTAVGNAALARGA